MNIWDLSGSDGVVIAMDGMDGAAETSAETARP